MEIWEVAIKNMKDPNAELEKEENMAREQRRSGENRNKVRFSHRVERGRQETEAWGSQKQSS